MDRSYASAIARRLHPDLDWPKPDDAVKDRLTRLEIQDQLDDLVKVYGDPNIDMPGYGGIGTSISCSVYDYTQPTREDGNYIVEEASRKKLAKNMKALKALGAKIEKQYTDLSMNVRATFDSGLVITCSVDRATVCKKKVVGTEYVPPSAGYTREIVEWDCEPVSLMEL